MYLFNNYSLLFYGEGSEPIGLDLISKTSNNNNNNNNTLFHPIICIK